MKIKKIPYSQRDFKFIEPEVLKSEYMSGTSIYNFIHCNTDDYINYTYDIIDELIYNIYMFNITGTETYSDEMERLINKLSLYHMITKCIDKVITIYIDTFFWKPGDYRKLSYIRRCNVSDIDMKSILLSIVNDKL